MTFSEAIRLGARLRPRQAFWVLYDAPTDATCVIGAAAEAIGILNTAGPNEPFTGPVPEAWRRTVFHEHHCPACWLWSDQVDRTAIHLNNEHRWSRELIADWVRLFEQPSSIAAVDPVPGIVAEVQRA